MKTALLAIFNEVTKPPMRCKVSSNLQKLSHRVTVFANLKIPLTHTAASVCRLRAHNYGLLIRLHCTMQGKVGQVWTL